MPSRRDRALLLGLAALTAALMAVAAAGGASSEALLFAPLLVLVLPLAGGRYVGERPLARLAAARAARPRRRIAGPVLLATRGPRAPRVLLARGGRLLAAALAVRPPPAGLVAAS